MAAPATAIPATSAVTIPKPRNPLPVETPRPTQVQVGVRKNGGQVFATVVKHNLVSITVAHLIGLQVHITKDDARELAHGLLAMLAD